MTPGQVAVLIAASFAAGVMNAMAGGGTMLTFPALVAAAVLFARMEALNPPELHCSSMTISWRNFGN